MITVNYKLAVKSPAARDRVVASVESALAGTDIAVSVTDGERGALGMPLWTTVWFSAEHGDYDRLRRDVDAQLERAGVADALGDLE